MLTLSGTPGTQADGVGDACRASILYVLGIFFIQRIIRAMHPVFGWTSFFRFFTVFLAFTVVANILYNIVSLCVAFVSTDNPDRFESALNLSKAGAIWNLLLVLYPLVPLLVASWIPGPRIEPFGYGPFRIKVAILVTGIVLLAVGTSIRLAEAFDRIPPGTEHEHPLYSKAVFYTTHFVFEILVVFLYAVARIDLRYHVPDGCTGPGDYSALSGGHEEKKCHSTKGQKGAVNRQQPCGSPAGLRPVLRRNSTSSTASSMYGPLVEAEGLPPRPRVSMRRSFVAAMGPVHRKSGGVSHRKRLPSSTAAGVASPSQTELTGWIREVANLDMDHMASSSTMVPLKGEDGNSGFGG